MNLELQVELTEGQHYRLSMDEVNVDEIPYKKNLPLDFNKMDRLWHLEWLETWPSRRGIGEKVLGSICNKAKEMAKNYGEKIYVFIEPQNGTREFYQRFISLHQLEKNCFYSPSPFNFDESGFYLVFAPETEDDLKF